MLDPESQRIHDGLLDHTLPTPEWTHEAHVCACHAVLSTRSAPEALDLLRSAIRSYNEATGVENTATTGYHETITSYYVTVVASLSHAPIDEVLTDDRTARDAPLRHWSRELLFSPSARAEWVEPDRSPLRF